MKPNTYFPKISFLITATICLLFSTCQKENESPIDSPNANGPSSSWDLEATLTLDDGEIIYFHCNFNSGGPYIEPLSPGDSVYNLFVPGNYNQKNLVFQGNITGSGDYNFTDWPEDGEIGMNIDFYGIFNDAGEFEHYMNYNEGNAPVTFHVISFSTSHIKATFSGELYNEMNNKSITVENGILETDLTVGSFPYGG